jgi:hypothetical protein
VIAGSDAEEHVGRRFPHKKTKRVGNSLSRPRSIRAFLTGLPIAFERRQARGLDATYHFIFTGEESIQSTIVIRDQKLSISEGLHGKSDLQVTADSATWLGFLKKEKNPFWALLRGEIRLKGNPRLLQAFGKCFP